MSSVTPAGSIHRRAFVASLMKKCPDTLVVAGLGSSAYDVFAAGDRPETFYLWGGMGGAAALGLGLALAQPDRTVLVITGDGEQLMGLGALASIGVQQPGNLTVVVLDNGHFGETGMQRSHSSLGTRLTKVAEACNFAWTQDIFDAGVVSELAERINSRQGCGLAQVHVIAEELPRELPPRDGVYIKNRFRAALGRPPQ